MRKMESKDNSSSAVKRKEPKFSVLMSVYDKENPEYLVEALDSIFAQTVKPDEIVLIEDGVLNLNLEEVINRYEKNHKELRVVRFNENRGLGASLHDGVALCNNEIIFRMDTDDISEPDRFKKQLRAFVETGADVIGGNIAEYSLDMRELTGKRLVPETHEDVVKRIKTKNPINHMTVAFKKAKVMEAGNYQPMQGFEDYYLWARMVKSGSKFYNIQEDLVKARGGSSLMTRRGGIKYLKSIRNFEKALLELGLVSHTTYFCNVLIRTAVCLSPTSLRKSFYKKALRK